MIYLYVKTHRHTGLKYLGKTTRDPYKYHGSGLYWKRHMKEYGCDVRTDIIFQSKCENEFSEFASAYSRDHDIVNSKEWANLREETGHGGFDKASARKGYEAMIKSGGHIKDSPNRRRFTSETARSAGSLGGKSNTGKKKSAEHRAKISAALKKNKLGKANGEPARS